MKVPSSSNSKFNKKSNNPDLLKSKEAFQEFSTEILTEEHFDEEPFTPEEIKFYLKEEFGDSFKVSDTFVDKVLSKLKN